MTMPAGLVRGRFFQWVKRAVLLLAKHIGLFSLARRATGRGVRILCYHGFNLDDEGQFRPTMFMAPELFRSRLAYLRAGGFPVVRLSELSDGLANGTLPDASVVITIDDGWYSTFSEAFPVLEEFGYPATVYVTTYYAEKQRPVFGMCLAYLFWKTKRTRVDLSEIGIPALTATEPVSLENTEEKVRLIDQITRYGQEDCSQPGRDELLLKVSTALDVELEPIIERRLFGLMSTDEIMQMAKKGQEIQLHTHRHFLPVDRAGAGREIDENRSVLGRVVDQSLVHFCYPSGEWALDHLDILPECEVVTATTCDPGLVYPETSRLAMPRITDTPGMAMIEFEAELSGFSDLLRRALVRLGLRAAGRAISRVDK